VVGQETGYELHEAMKQPMGRRWTSNTPRRPLPRGSSPLRRILIRWALHLYGLSRLAGSEPERCGSAALDGQLGSGHGVNWD